MVNEVRGSVALKKKKKKGSLAELGPALAGQRIETFGLAQRQRILSHCEWGLLSVPGHLKAFRNFTLEYNLTYFFKFWLPLLNRELKKMLAKEYNSASWSESSKSR
jgi:hypothetical protein